jgi:acyl-CoA synthetase (AMP-forming)/AMP-acid ligase II
VQIGSIIRRAAIQFGDAPCLTEGERKLSFRDFDAATDRLGNALVAKGLLPGDRVAVLLPNSIDCLIAYYAVFKAGLVRVQLNVRETLDNHRYKIEYTGCRCVIHAGVDGIEAEVEILPPELLDMIANGDPVPCAIDRDLDAPLRLGFTGGTTGKSKAVTLTTRTDLVETSVFLSDLIPELREGQVFLHGAPIAHAGGAFFLPSLIRGVHSVIMTKFDTGEYLALADESQATYTFLVPTMIAMLLDDPSIERAQTAFEIIAYGASSISPNLMARAEARFGRVFAQCYGQAESPMAITYLRPEHHNRVGSCGRPFSGGRSRDLRRGGSAAAAGRTRRDRLPGPADNGLLLGPPRGDGQGLPQRLAAHRRHRRDGRRGLLLYRRPQERHADLRRLQRLSA